MDSDKTFFTRRTGSLGAFIFSSDSIKAVSGKIILGGGSGALGASCAIFWTMISPFRSWQRCTAHIPSAVVMVVQIIAMKAIKSSSQSFTCSSYLHRRLHINFVLFTQFLNLFPLWSFKRKHCFSEFFPEFSWPPICVQYASA